MFIPGIFEGIRPENKDNPKEFIFNPPKKILLFID
jgi:hypothetical protein